MITALIISIVLLALVVYTVCFGWAALLIAIVAIVITVCVTIGATRIFKSYENHRASKRRQQKVQATDGARSI